MLHSVPFSSWSQVSRPNFQGTKVKRRGGKVWLQGLHSMPLVGEKMVVEDIHRYHYNGNGTVIR